MDKKWLEENFDYEFDFNPTDQFIHELFYMLEVLGDDFDDSTLTNLRKEKDAKLKYDEYMLGEVEDYNVFKKYNKCFILFFGDHTLKLADVNKEVVNIKKFNLDIKCDFSQHIIENALAKYFVIY